ncbi:hypothetical protein [Algoriphagus boritolerans]|uniref:YceI-like domain-containing protein n=1 Tax=Algoriphagus boritolerans DSM 17298 = JCM 18970 TaxID=1120964 RepID=A0A1H5ZLH6_9BACT|nr:hypothetical protein [Algoriphagus boritolerans]SEG37403.1 hypothetical protein SAMN03080598_03595 [Algoriphagus boritolerans DSM 17298 = JCM 18970]
MQVLILMIFIFFAALTQQQRELVITDQRVKVSGYTSLGKFNCDFSRVGMKDKLQLNSTGDLSTLEFKIPVKSFSCGNFLLNNDFRSTLKANEYPYALVTVSNFRLKSGNVYCSMVLDLVGQKLNFPDILLERNKEGMSANLILNFEMLNLSPPSKFGGLVKVENQLDLEFHLGM